MTILSADASPASAQSDPLIDPATVVVDVPLVIDANTADSSTVDVPDAKAPTSLLDVVKSAVVKPAEPESSSTPAPDPAVPAVEAPVVPEAEVADADLPFHNHPRWKAVLGERDALVEPARQYGQIQQFMEVNNLLPDEVAEGYQIMASLKSGDPAKLAEVREWFADRLQYLDRNLGNVLPDDLQAKVDEGLIDEAGATEIAQSRAKSALLESQSTERATRTVEQQRETDAQAASLAMGTAVLGWEASIKKTDPDYAKKADLIETTVRAIVHRTGKPPTNAEEALALVKQAHGEVTTQLHNLSPKPRPIVPVVTTGTSTHAQPAPTTLKEVIARAAGG